MEYWHFSECAYPDLPDPDTYDSVRVKLPNGVIDPQRAADLWDRYIREWQVADECGINVMVNEHHSTATCMTASVSLVAAALARVTQNARILVLGNPVANRPDPVRVAEEMVMVDLLSRGRLEMGFVRGAQYEINATNTNPVRTVERMWEAIDLIMRALTTHDGPFSWEGEFFQHRQVNIWPRAYQQPAPPVWITSGTPNSIKPIADRDYRVASFLAGLDGARGIFDAYRVRQQETGKDVAGDERFAYAGLTYTGRTDAEGIEGARKLLWYLHSNKVLKEFAYPPGFMPYFARSAALRGPRASTSGQPLMSPLPIATMSVEELIEKGVLFAGSPQTVAGQIERFYNHVGGFGHFLHMGQAGHMTHEETVGGIRRFAEEVVPRLERVTEPVG